MEQLLQKYFGYDRFRPGQAEIIGAIRSGRDALGIMPTGAGKSVCYQIPALMLPGVTLVLSPLISLMQDQVDALRLAGVPAAFVNSSLDGGQQEEILRQTAAGRFKILYMAPERLLLPAFLAFARRTPISMVTVDEAHCISQWGQDFRPSYLKIAEFLSMLPRRPIVSAFTATATAEVREDIIRSLGLNDPFVLTTGFDRPNLWFGVQKPQSKPHALLELLRARPGRSGIVYCGTRKVVEEVCEMVSAAGFEATRYHAGLSDEERRRNQEAFLFDRATVMVATNAFGMGIDKSNVSFVIHYNMPKNLESYYQEAGRAGRDGSPADCILLFSPKDVTLSRYLIEHGREEDADPAQQAREYERLRQMAAYCGTTDCLRAHILSYFGEETAPHCGHCSNCGTEFAIVDRTIEAQKILSCVYRLHARGRAFGKGMITDILRGSKNEKLLGWHLDTLSTYGIMADVGAREIRALIDELELRGYLETTSGSQPVIRLTGRARQILFEKAKFEVKEQRLARAVPDAKGKSRAGADEIENSALFDRLRGVRKRLADEARVPVYVVFSNATLADLCRRLPVTRDEFLEVHGVGEAKADRYATDFLNAIKDYLRETQS